MVHQAGVRGVSDSLSAEMTPHWHLITLPGGE